MLDHSTAFFTLTLLALLVVLLIFGMKYFSATRQTAGGSTLAALQADLGEVKLRLAAIEKMLKEVG
jgi:hypothetical protein